MDIPQLITTLGVCGLVCYGVWWALQRVRMAPKAQSSPDALAKIAAFDLIVATIQPGTSDVIEACALIRAQLAEKLMPMGSDAK